MKTECLIWQGDGGMESDSERQPPLYITETVSQLADGLPAHLSSQEHSALTGCHCSFPSLMLKLRRSLEAVSPGRCRMRQDDRSCRKGARSQVCRCHSSSWQHHARLQNNLPGILEITVKASSVKPKQIIHQRQQCHRDDYYLKTSIEPPSSPLVMILLPIWDVFDIMLRKQTQLSFCVNRYGITSVPCGISNELSYRLCKCSVNPSNPCRLD